MEGYHVQGKSNGRLQDTRQVKTEGYQVQGKPNGGIPGSGVSKTEGEQIQGKENWGIPCTGQAKRGGYQIQSKQNGGRPDTGKAKRREIRYVVSKTKRDQVQAELYRGIPGPERKVTRYRVIQMEGYQIQGNSNGTLPCVGSGQIHAHRSSHNENVSGRIDNFNYYIKSNLVSDGCCMTGSMEKYMAKSKYDKGDERNTSY
ncbi:unnamed protein product [Mytilus coruscus]|uniref:Uncharacterized protein n=1 Tax=Mytilus coruscus TaxID=42192 RepID=A0A6J8D1W2_MYTCO|nr:unnamed protein product [Mytilus coruscus]